MTNFERWQCLTANLVSPQSWIDFGFYFLITSALQRRVWYYGSGEDGSALYPNLYGCFVGPPGCGKGLVLGTVSRLLKFHKFEAGKLIKTSIGNEKPLLIPVGADSITFEELLVDISDNTRRVVRADGTIYAHNSYCFVLEELDSLFKRKTQDVVSFLKNAYDCKDYDYKTKNQGQDLLRRLCLSMLSGTQPDFLFDARKNGIFGQGYASRTLWLFETKKRFHKFHTTELSEEQRQCEKELLAWVLKLAGLYGGIQYDTATYSFLERWESDILAVEEATSSSRLADYYSRKKVTMLKLAAGIHFGENLTFHIPIETFVKAISWLKSVESRLESGLGNTGRNELHGYQKRIHEYVLSRGSVGLKDILIAFGADLSVPEVKEILEALLVSGLIKHKAEKNNDLYYI